MSNWIEQVVNLQEIPDIESFTYNNEGLFFICKFNSEKNKYISKTINL